MSQSRILFIAPLPPPVTGQAVACEALHADLVRRGHEVTLINLSKQSFRQGANSVRRIFEIAAIVGQTLKHRRAADLVYLTPAESVAGNLKDLAILLCLGRKIRHTYLHLHGGAGMRNILHAKNSLLQKCNAWLLRRVGGVIVLGERHRSIYDHIVAPDKIHAVKNFAGHDCFIGAPELAQKWDAPSRLNVLFLSNHLPGKGYGELVSAIQELPPATAAAFSFHFAGGFENAEAREQFLQTISTLDNVRYHGTVLGEEKRRLFHEAHLFCLPTYYPYEGQPISILEAYASGCAVLTTDHSGIFDIFTPDKNGWEVQPRSAASIAQALEHAHTHFQALARMGCANAEQAKIEFREAQHLNALRQCLGLNQPSDTSPAARD